MRQVPALALGFWLQGFGAANADGLGPLTGQPGDPARGEALLLDMRRVSCLICHQVSSLDERDQGQIGPALDGVASRLDDMELRQRVVDARVFNPDTIMPPYYSVKGLVDVADRYRGQTIYGAQEVEDVVAYLLTLTEESNR